MTPSKLMLSIVVSVVILKFLTGQDFSGVNRFDRLKKFSMSDPTLASEAKAGPRFKVVFVGNSSVGKTSIIMRYCDQSFFEDRPPTIGSAFVTREITTEYGRASLQIWDTAGQERYRSLVPMYSRGAAIAVVVFDLTNHESFEDIGMWIDQVKSEASHDCQIVIAANKSDLTAAIEMSEIDQWARDRNLDVVYVSAKRGDNVNLLFDAVIGHLPAAAFRLHSPDVTIDDSTPSAKARCC
jgi:small GTP-binding protein